MKTKLKSYEFWVSIVGAVTVLLQSISAKLNAPYVSECAMALLGALAVWGILKKAPAEDGKGGITENNSQESSTEESRKEGNEQEQDKTNKNNL